MRSISHAICAASVAISGCVAFPELPSETRINVAQVIDNIECEIQRAAEKDFGQHYWLLGWAATLTLNLDTKNTSSGTGDIVLGVPLVPEAFGLTLSTGPTKNRNASGSFSYNTSLMKILEKPCGEDSKTATSSVLTGRTGAGDWLRRIADNKAVPKVCPAGITFSIDFSIAITGDGSPRITGVEVGDGTLATGLKLSGKNTGEHKLTFAAVPIADAKPPTGPAQDQVDSLFAKASDIVFRKEQVRVTKDDIRNCAPIEAILVARQLITGRPPIEGFVPEIFAAPPTGLNDETVRALNQERTRAILEQILGEED